LDGLNGRQSFGVCAFEENLEVALHLQRQRQRQRQAT
jgi:hypothetical protein